jgi:hypothetical protein
MPPTSPGDADRWAKVIQESLADTSAVREGLTDDDAIPLVDWGIICAQFLGQQLCLPGTAEPTQEQAGNLGYALTRLMTRLNWLVTYRHKKDAAWLTRTFQMVNQLAKELYGESAPAVPDDEIAAWIAAHAGQSNGDLLRGLIARYTPPALAQRPITPADPAAPTMPDNVQTLTPPGVLNDQTQ